MKTLFAILALFSIAPAIVTASTVTLSSTSTGPSVFASNAVNLVPNGSLIRVGTFLGGIETLANWRDFGLSTVKSAGIGTGARPSKVTGTVTNTGGDVDDAQFNGLAVYVWIYNSTTINPLAEQGIFKSTFLFPVNDFSSTADSVTPTAISFTTAIGLEGLFTAGQYIPNVDNGTGSLTGGKFVLGVPIPETSTSMFLASVLGLMTLRRRR